MHHLEDCVQSAGKMVSSAATIVESRSVRGTSEFGDHMNEDQRRASRAMDSQTSYIRAQ